MHVCMYYIVHIGSGAQVSCLRIAGATYMNGKQIVLALDAQRILNSNRFSHQYFAAVTK